MGLISFLGLSACRSHKNVVEVRDDDQNANIDQPTETIPEVSETTDTIAPSGIFPEERDPVVLLYGVPRVNYTVKGRVVNQDGNPVKGIQVLLVNSHLDVDNMPDSPYWDRRLQEISDTTDDNGEFTVNTSDSPWEQVRVMTRDIDGKANGSYQNQLIDVEFQDQKNGNRRVSEWELSTKTAEITVKLQKK